MTTDLAAAGTAAPGFRLAPELTIGSIWLSASDRAVDDDLRWPPDLFALTDVALDRPEAYRFAVSPPAGRNGLQPARHHETRPWPWPPGAGATGCRSHWKSRRTSSSGSGRSCGPR